MGFETCPDSEVSTLLSSKYPVTDTGELKSLLLSQVPILWISSRLEIKDFVIQFESCIYLKFSAIDIGKHRLSHSLQVEYQMGRDNTSGSLTFWLPVAKFVEILGNLKNKNKKQ